MIRTNIVKLTSIPAIAYRQKLPSGGSGVTIYKKDVRQPGIASISSSGEAIPSSNTPLQEYPIESFQEAISLTFGIPYKKRNGLGNDFEKIYSLIDEEETIEKEEVANESEEELKEVEVIIDSDEYQRILELYTDAKGKLSYDLLNRDFIQTAHSSGQVKLMIENHDSLDDIRFQIVKARLRSITRNPALTDEQIHKMIELLDEVSPKGVFKQLNDEIRTWQRKNKNK